jgi:hypothetical protein
MEAGQLKPSYIPARSIKALQKTFSQFFNKLSIDLLYNSANYPWEHTQETWK